MNNQDTGYVLNVVPYRETDAMVSLMGERYGLQRFILRGFYKQGSKQGSLGLEFSKVIYRFNYKENSLLRVQTGELISAYAANRTSFEWLTYNSFIAELCLKCNDSLTVSTWLNVLEMSFSNINKALLVVILAEIIIATGYVPYVDGCVITNDSNVSDFSIEKGGFVSLRYRTTNSKTTLEILQVIKYLFSTKVLDYKRLEGLKDLQIIIEILVEYLEYHADFKFYSWKLISSV